MNNLTLRIISASVLIPVVLILSFQMPSIWFLVFLVIVVILSFYEFFALVNSTLMDKIITILLSIILLLLLYLSVIASFIAMILFILTIVFWLKNAYLVINYPNKKPSKNNFLNILNAIFLFMPLLGLLVFNSLEYDEVLLLLFLIVWGADSFAYIFGKLFGKHKLVPRLSNGKTIEGVIGGILSSAVLAFIWMKFNDVNNYGYIILAVITAGFSIIGDLYQSIYKREANVKNSGNIIPGHGGIWDRVDGLLAAVPIFTTGLIFINL